MNVTSCAMHCRFPIENGMKACRGRPTTLLARSVRQTYRRSSGPSGLRLRSGVFVMPLNTRPPGLAWSVRSIG